MTCLSDVHYMIVSSMETFLIKNYGSLTMAAGHLNVSVQTINNWLKRNPRGLLKHMPTMVQQCNVTETQIMGEVLYHEEYLQNIEKFKS
jgi:hypothetical protein